MKLKKGDIVSLKWEDSAGFHEGWVTYEYDLKPAIIASVGKIVETNDKYVVLSHTLAEGNVVYSPIAIPWNCVVEWRKIDEGKQEERLSSGKGDSQSGRKKRS